jgi:hypothetical protein
VPDPSSRFFFFPLLPCFLRFAAASCVIDTHEVSLKNVVFFGDGKSLYCASRPNKSPTIESICASGGAIPPTRPWASRDSRRPAYALSPDVPRCSLPPHQAPPHAHRPAYRLTPDVPRRPPLPPQARRQLSRPRRQLLQSPTAMTVTSDPATSAKQRPPRPTAIHLALELCRAPVHPETSGGYVSTIAPSADPPCTNAIPAAS